MPRVLYLGQLPHTTIGKFVKSTPLITPNQLAQCHVLVVGDAMLDRYWYGAVERISPEAPVPVVRVTREEDRLGGAANVALNVQTLGAQATLLTVLGQDEPARKLQQLLQEQGVRTVLGQDPKLYTIVKLRVIGRAQQLIRVDFENTPDHEILEAMLGDFERSLPQMQAVLFSDYGKGGLTHIAHMIELARASGKPVLVDPKGLDYSLYANATVITPNRAELAQVVGPWATEAELHKKAQALRRKLHLDCLLLTRSEEGMSLFDAKGHIQVDAQAKDVFDVTGAGDTVVATFAALLGCGLSPRDALPLANKAGSIVVGKFGTASVSYEELFA